MCLHVCVCVYVCTYVHVCKAREAHRKRIPGSTDCMCKGPGAGRSRGYLRKNFKEANLSVLEQGEG